MIFYGPNHFFHQHRSSLEMENEPTGLTVSEHIEYTSEKIYIWYFHFKKKTFFFDPNRIVKWSKHYTSDNGRTHNNTSINQHQTHGTSYSSVFFIYFFLFSINFNLVFCHLSSSSSLLFWFIIIFSFDFFLFVCFDILNYFLRFRFIFSDYCYYYYWISQSFINFLCLIIIIIILRYPNESLFR